MSFLSFIPCGIPASGRLVYRPVYPQAAEAITATPGFIRGVYEYYRRRREDETEPVERESPISPTERAMREYAERSEVLTRAIQKVRAESAAIKAEIDALRERLERRTTTQKALARFEGDLLLKEQAATLARAEEAALLEEMELNDVMGVAVIALAYVMQ